MHCSECSCKARFTYTQFILQHKDRATTELAEGFHFRIRGSHCISHTSLIVLDTEVLLLRRGYKRKRKREERQEAGRLSSFNTRTQLTHYWVSAWYIPTFDFKKTSSW